MVSIPYMAGAEPIFELGNEVGCLILHGFMASPGEVRWLSQHLATQGFTVYAPRLPGHGTQPEDMARVRWQDWVAAARDGDHLLRQVCQKVFVIGHSMGGTLGLLLATQIKLDGLALLAAPITLHQRTTRWASRISWLLPYTDQSDKTPFPDYVRREQARLGEPVYGRLRYDRWSTAAVGQLYHLTETARAHLKAVTAPLLLVNSLADPTVLPENADLIAQSVSSSIIERRLLQRSGHILPQEVEREQVFAWVSDFVRGCSTA